MTKKLEMLVITGKLEVRYKESEDKLNELKNLQQQISTEDIVGMAIAFGRLEEVVKKEDEELNQLREYILSNEEKKTDLTIQDMSLSTRAYTVLDRAGIRSVEHLAAMSFKELRKLPNLGETAANEVADKLNALGFKLRERE